MLISYKWGVFHNSYTENWETRQLIVGYDKEFLSSINYIGNLYTSIIYIDKYPGIFEAFNTILNEAANPQINRLYILHIDPPTVCNFRRYIDHSIFSTLKYNSYLLEHGKQIITKNRHPGEPRYNSHEDSPSCYILTVKAILMSPVFFFFYMSHEA